MCHKIRLFNVHFKVLIIENTIKEKILPNITTFLRPDFEKLSSACVPLLFSPPCLFV